MHSVVNPGPAGIVDDARATHAIIMSAASAALGGLLFGFDTGVISGATSVLQN
jgi:SP family xylose:H+ symportor-like MFS transporter